MIYRQSDWSISFFGEKVGQLSMFFWFGGMNIMFVMSINRYVAIKYPLRYKDVSNCVFKFFRKTTSCRYLA